MIEIFAQSEAMQEAVGLAERVADTDANVLVTGESGVGKDALAFFYPFAFSARPQPYVKMIAPPSRRVAGSRALWIRARCVYGRR